MSTDGCLGWRADSNRQHEDLLNNVRNSAREQVPFNIEKVSTVGLPHHHDRLLIPFQYLNDFSRSLAREVRQLLNEVNDLVREKTRLQAYVFVINSHEIMFTLSPREIAMLLEFQARYQPGGFFW